MFESVLNEDSGLNRQTVRILGKVPTDFKEGDRVYQHVNCTVIENLSGRNAKGFGSAILKIEDLELDASLDEYNFPLTVDVLTTSYVDKYQKRTTIIKEVFLDTVVELSLVSTEDLDKIKAINPADLQKLMKPTANKTQAQADKA